MLTLTDAAAGHLAQLRQQQGAQDDKALRFVCESEGLSLRLAGELEGDTTFQHEGRTMLVLDSKVAELLSEVTLDLDGKQRRLQYPDSDISSHP